MIKAAIFDMDGVIVHTEPIQEKVWKKFFSENGIEIQDSDLPRMKGLRSIDVIQLFMPSVIQTEIEKHVKTRRALYRKQLIETPPVAVPGIFEFVQNLKQKQVKIAVATSAVLDIANPILESVHLKSLVDILVTGEDVSRGKPDPEIYLKTAEKLRVQSSECLVFEDAHAGVESAQAAHMKVVALLTSHGKKDFPDVSLTIKDFNEINIEDLLSM